MDLFAKLIENIRSGDNEGIVALIQYLSATDEGTHYRPALEDILNLKTKKKYSALHEAIFQRNLEALKLLIDAGIDVNAKCHGTPPTHLCLATSTLPNGFLFANEALRYILTSDAVLFDSKVGKAKFDLCLTTFMCLSCKCRLQDDQGGSMVHLAAEYNNVEALMMITSKYDRSMDLINVKDRVGWFPIHRAVSKDCSECFTTLLELGGYYDTTTSHGMNIAHTAVIFGAFKCWSKIKQLPQFDLLCQKADIFERTVEDVVELYGYDLESYSTKKLLKLNSRKFPTNMTGIVTDHVCLEHHTCLPSEASTTSAPPENYHRLKVLIDSTNGVLQSSDISCNLQYITECKSAAISDVLRVHEWSYIRKVQAKCESLDANPYDEGGIGYLDGDTTISKKSFDAALKSCGAVCHAVDLVMKKEVKNCFCPIRPPGHHAGRD